MEQDNSRLQVATPHGLPTVTDPNRTRSSETLRRLSTGGTANALDLIPSKPVTSDVFTTAIATMQAVYGADYAPEKISVLFEMIREEGWTEERFKRTFKWFLKHKKFATWTIADWFDFGIEVHSYSWYLEQVNEFGRDVNKRIEVYKIEGTVVYRYADGEILPFERID
jgi:hypothetical protein